MEEKFISYITSSQTRVFPDSEVKESISSVLILKNEPVSFAVAYKAENAECHPISISAECLGADVSVYKVGYVPVTYVKSSMEEVANENRGAGLYPDILYKRNAMPVVLKGNDPLRIPFYEENEKNPLNAADIFQSVLVTVNENKNVLKAGNYKLAVKITSLSTGEILAEHIVDIKVIDKELAEREFMYTNWFHYDCVSDIHGVELYSREYFLLLEKYFKNAVMHGMNTILMPAFTPPLDTCIGENRQNVQLVKITKTDSGYEFDFSLLEKFVSLALKCGFRCFEHSHLFTQWGAKHTPAIYAEVCGNEERIFGWDTDASGNDYKEFLNSYIPAFLDVSKKLGINDKLFFHISDEPSPENQESYGNAVETVKNLIKGYKSGDALADIRFYKNGFVKTPIVQIDNAELFFENCDAMWLYFTCGQYPGTRLHECANRLLTTKPYRTRILGLHLYKYKCSGFLHWGYNYYYDRMSKGLVDPKTTACGYKNLPGAAYIVYPGNNEVYPSLREKYMSEAINDYKALKLLEEYIGYDNVIKLCDNYFGEKVTVTTIPKSDEQMICFREMINSEIEKFI